MTFMNSTNYDTYRELDITTASPEKLILMLFDGAINFLSRARVKLVDGDYTAKGEFMIKAVSIITELLNSLNPKAGEIATSLASLYVYFLRRLMEADLNRDMEGIEEVIGFMRELREAWQMLVTGDAERPTARLSEKTKLSFSLN